MSESPLPASLFSVPALAALNHVLDQADWARRKLQPFVGRNARIAMPPFSLVFLVNNDGRLESSSAVPDLDIVLAADTPLLAIQGSERVMKSAQISGPADFADALGFVLRNLKWDIEEDLSKVFGDIAAHRIVAALTGFADWQRQAAGNLAENAVEYLLEENPVLVKPADIAVFADEVGHLRSDVTAIEERIDRLRKNIS